MSYLDQMLTSSGKTVVMIVASAFLVNTLFLFSPLPHAEAASMIFTSDTTITTNQTIASHETWSINGGVTVTIASGVTVQNNGTIWNQGVLINNGTLVNSQGDFPDDFGIENYEKIINYV